MERIGPLEEPLSIEHVVYIRVVAAAASGVTAAISDAEAQKRYRATVVKQEIYFGQFEVRHSASPQNPNPSTDPNPNPNPDPNPNPQP